MGKYSGFKEEAKTLHEEKGYGSDRIAAIICRKHPELSVASLGRHIRRAGWLAPSAIDESMHRNNVKPGGNWKVAWIKDKVGVSTLVVNPDFKDAGVVDYNLIREEMIAEMSKLSPKVKAYKRKVVDDPHCLVLDIADLHIGKLATSGASNEEYNVKIAVDRAVKGSMSLINKADPYNIDMIYFVIGNDVLHTDTPKGTTTSGTQMDTCGTWYDNFKVAREVYAEIIQSLSTIAPVHIIHCPSNHDYMTGFMLADAIQCYFHNNENISFDVTNKHRKYVSYGTSMLMFSHGDGCKIDQIPYLAAHERPQLWSKTTYRYGYLHHIHHKDFFKFRAGKDFIGMTVEYLRSPSGHDRWHTDNGYVGAKVAIEAFIHHPVNGQVSRLTHNF